MDCLVHCLPRSAWPPHLAQLDGGRFWPMADWWTIQHVRRFSQKTRAAEGLDPLVGWPCPRGNFCSPLVGLDSLSKRRTLVAHSPSTSASIRLRCSVELGFLGTSEGESIRCVASDCFLSNPRRWT